jgi:hypothetical protein
LARALPEETVKCAALPLAAWYLDDGCLGGTKAAVEAAFSSLSALESIGLRVNPRKCEWISPSLAPAPFPSLLGRRPSHWDLLGIPMGDEASVAVFLASVADRTITRNRLIATLGITSGERAPAAALLRHCSGGCMSVYYARAVGAAARPALSRIDTNTRDAWEALHMRVSDEVARIPVGFGGCGLRPSAEHAELAYFASATDTAPTEALLLLNLASFPDFRRPAVSNLPISWPSVAEAVAKVESGEVRKEVQRTLCSALERDFAGAWLASDRASQYDRARASSCAVAHASSWIAPPPGADPPVFLETGPYLALWRLRLGLSFDDTHTKVKCTLCGEVADDYGQHALNCRSAGGRHRIHNALRDCLVSCGVVAAWQPVPEPVCYPSLPGRRADVLFSIPHHGVKLAVDVAFVTVRSANVDAAAAEPGGVATAYQRVKQRSYGNAPTVDGVPLIPLIIDSFGAWGSAALPWLRQFAVAWGARLNHKPPRAIVLFFALLAGRLMAEVGRSLHAAQAWLLPSYRGDGARRGF